MAAKKHKTIIVEKIVTYEEPEGISLEMESRGDKIIFIFLYIFFSPFIAIGLWIHYFNSLCNTERIVKYKVIKE